MTDNSLKAVHSSVLSQYTSLKAIFYTRSYLTIVMSKVIKIVSRAKSTQPHKKSSRVEPSRAMRQPAQTCIVLMYSKFHCCFEQKSASLYFLEDSGILKCIKPNTTRQLSSLVEATISSLIHEPSQSGLSGVEFDSSQLTRPIITLQGISTQAYTSSLIHMRLHKTLHV